MKKYIIALIYFVSVLSFNAFAGSIKTVKGKQVLISLDGDSVREGQELKVRDASKKLRAIVKVKKVGKTQAIAEIVKGKAEVGYVIGNRSPAAVDADGSSSYDTEVTSPSSLTKSRYGVLGAYLNNSMNAKYSVNSVDYQTTMTGSGFGVLGYYDFTLTKDFEVRGSAGLEQFSTKNAGCGGNLNCDVNINYISAYGLAKYKFTKGKTQIWGGGGLGFLTAMSKSSTVLDVGQISSNQVFTLALGADIAMSKKQVLPVALEMSMFPSSGTVSASMMSLKVGWGWGL